MWLTQAYNWSPMSARADSTHAGEYLFLAIPAMAGTSSMRKVSGDNLPRTFKVSSRLAGRE